MVSELESKVRKLDNKRKSIAKSASEIARKSGINEMYATNIIFAKRQGFSSFNEWLRSYLKKRGFSEGRDYLNYLAERNGFKDYKELRDRVYMNKGFCGRADYDNYLHHKNSGHVKNEEEYFEGIFRSKLDTEHKDAKYFDNLVADNDYSLISILENADKKEEIKALLEKIINKLPKKYQRVIRGRFYEEKTLEEIGKELKISRERVRQIEQYAIKRLYCPAKHSGLYELYSDNNQ